MTIESIPFYVMNLIYSIFYRVVDFLGFVSEIFSRLSINYSYPELLFNKRFMKKSYSQRK